MRQVLVDYARGRGAAERGAAVAPIALDSIPDVSVMKEKELVELHDALSELQQIDGAKARLSSCDISVGLQKIKSPRRLE